MSAGGGTLVVPESHRSLLESTVDVVLTTVGGDGYPHSSMVWCSYDGVRVLLNTGRGYAKERNMRRSPRVSVFACDPSRWVEVQGDAELVEEGAVEHLNQLCYSYTGKRDFYRDLMPELAGRETRVIVRVTPTRVRYGEAI
jgi:PPOX class probable F420-dependent enzyme